MTAGFARRKQEWELDRSLANKDVDIADRQVAAAQTEQSIAESDQQVAIVQMNHAGRGITGSARLLQDIYRLDQRALDTDRRKLHLTQTVAVSEIAASNCNSSATPACSPSPPPKRCSTATSPGTTCGSSKTTCRRSSPASVPAIAAWGSRSVTVCR
jgi:hypothetical protein